MIDIAVQDIPNQSFSIVLDDSQYLIALRESNGVMVADVTRDGVVLLLGSRVCAGTPIIPYRYLQEGNFVLLTDDDAIPYYTGFGFTQSLVYVSADEIAALEAAPTPRFSSVPFSPSIRVTTGGVPRALSDDLTLRGYT